MLDSGGSFKPKAPFATNIPEEGGGPLETEQSWVDVDSGEKYDFSPEEETIRDKVSFGAFFGGGGS